MQFDWNREHANYLFVSAIKIAISSPPNSSRSEWRRNICAHRIRAFYFLFSGFVKSYITSIASPSTTTRNYTWSFVSRKLERQANNILPDELFVGAHSDRLNMLMLRGKTLMGFGWKIIWPSSHTTTSWNLWLCEKYFDGKATSACRHKKIPGRLRAPRFCGAFSSIFQFWFWVRRAKNWGKKAHQ